MLTILSLKKEKLHKSPLSSQKRLHLPQILTSNTWVATCSARFNIFLIIFDTNSFESGKKPTFLSSQFSLCIIFYICSFHKIPMLFLILSERNSCFKIPNEIQRNAISMRFSTKLSFSQISARFDMNTQVRNMLSFQSVSCNLQLISKDSCLCCLICAK